MTCFSGMNKQRAIGRKDGYACISGLADNCERPHMSTEQRKAARAADAGRGANVWSDAGARKSEAARSLFIHACERPHMSTDQRKAVKAPKNAGKRMCGAMRELARAKQRVVLFIHACGHPPMAASRTRLLYTRLFCLCLCLFLLPALTGCGTEGTGMSAGGNTGSITQTAQQTDAGSETQDTGQEAGGSGGESPGQSAPEAPPGSGDSLPELQLLTRDDSQSPEDLQLLSGGEGQAEGELPPDSENGTATELLPEDGSYTTADDVALYLHTYGRLPDNFMTKKEAKKTGWSGGSLERYAPGMCIGGDHFGNYEGILPDGDYRECDINTLGKKNRGAERLIFSDDGRIYYTGDHYRTFTLLYGSE